MVTSLALPIPHHMFAHHKKSAEESEKKVALIYAIEAKFTWEGTQLSF